LGGGVGGSDWRAAGKAVGSSGGINVPPLTRLPPNRANPDTAPRIAAQGDSPVTPESPPTNDASTRPVFSVVVPMFNEAASILLLHTRLSAVMDSLGDPWEVVYVNDGSRDATLPTVEALRDRDPHVAVINLSRNFGKEIATTAGLDHARGAAVIVIDADLQDPPEVIPQLVATWRDGFDMVYGRRREREGETWLKTRSAALFYRLMRNWGQVELPPDTGDFRLMSRRAVDALLKLREQHRFMKGLFAWVGFPSKPVFYDRAPRAAGETKWNYWKLWNLAIEGFTSYSVLPLKLATYVGAVVALLAALFGIVVVVRTLAAGGSPAGYPSLLVVVLLLGGTQLIFLGVIGEYLGRVFNETKQRPLYLVERYLPSRPDAAVSEANSKLIQSGH
jgi:glycosyltransferase involved in cell wall biosynthesis